jgi:methylaspartate mutase sigma subunit
MQYDKQTIITGVIGEDVHVIGIRIMEHALRNAGFHVVSLGIHNTQEDFVAAAKEANAGCIMISSLGGHAEILVQGIRQACEKAGIGKIHLSIGGQLVIHEEPWSETEKRFKLLGFDRVYKPFILPAAAIDLLMKDMGINQDTFKFVEN